MYNVKKKLNSLLSLFLLIAFLCAPLTGCNGAQNPNDSQNPIHTETESVKDSVSESDTGSEPGSSEKESTLPTESQEPSQSEDPSQSQEPSESQKPDNSEDHGTSQEPSESEKPSNSEQPGSSEEPIEPEPSESEDPGNSEEPGSGATGTDMDTPGISISDIPAYADKDYIPFNTDEDNPYGVPHFATSSSTIAYEFYSELDSLGRCGVAYAVLGPELMPADDRENIGHVTPSGWVTKDDGNPLYNRSHLIAHSLAGENDNPKNLITGTSHMNQHTMQIFENMILDRLTEAIENQSTIHIMYRVTPFYEGNNLVATGVQMEAWSVEDNGESICFNVFCYNIQEGVSIDYATGDYELIETNYLYIVNGNNGKIHTYECGIKSNMGNPIYCETLEEAEEASAKIKGSAQYAGCCMK